MTLATATDLPAIDDADADFQRQIAAALEASMQSAAEEKQLRKQPWAPAADARMQRVASTAALALPDIIRTTSPALCPQASLQVTAAAAPAAAQGPSSAAGQHKLYHVVPQACVNIPRAAQLSQHHLAAAAAAAAGAGCGPGALLATSPGKHAREASLAAADAQPLLKRSRGLDQVTLTGSCGDCCSALLLADAQSQEPSPERPASAASSGAVAPSFDGCASSSPPIDLGSIDLGGSGSRQHSSSSSSYALAGALRLALDPGQQQQPQQPALHCPGSLLREGGSGGPWHPGTLDGGQAGGSGGLQGGSSSSEAASPGAAERLSCHEDGTPATAASTGRPGAAGPIQHQPLQQLLPHLHQPHLPPAERRYHVGQRVLWFSGAPDGPSAAVVARIDRRSSPLLYMLVLDSDGDEVMAFAEDLLPLLAYREAVMVWLPDDERPAAPSAAAWASAAAHAPTAAGGGVGGWRSGLVDACDLMARPLPLACVSIVGMGPVVVLYADVQPVSDVGEGSRVGDAVALQRQGSASGGARIVWQGARSGPALDGHEDTNACRALVALGPAANIDDLD